MYMYLYIHIVTEPVSVCSLGAHCVRFVMVRPDGPNDGRKYDLRVRLYMRMHGGTDTHWHWLGCVTYMIVWSLDSGVYDVKNCVQREIFVPAKKSLFITHYVIINAVAVSPAVSANRIGHMRFIAFVPMNASSAPFLLHKLPIRYAYVITNYRMTRRSLNETFATFFFLFFSVFVRRTQSRSLLLGVKYSDKVFFSSLSLRTSQPQSI